MPETLTYNGISLGIGQKRKVSIEVMQTPDGRQTQYHRIQIEVDAVIAQVSGLGSDADTIRRTLTRSGGRLVASEIGIGFDLDIGGNSTTKDCLGGPFPKLMHFQPMAASNSSAIEVHWVVEANVFIPPSVETTGLQPIAAFTYSQSYSLDNGGWTTRTTNGALTVVKEFWGPDRINHNADYFRDQIKIKKPEGYERRQQYSLSEDKATLSFSIVDTQIKTRQPYPPGVIDIRATHSVTKTRSQMATTLHHISVQVEIAADRPTIYAWFVFQQIVLKRIYYANSQQVQVLIDQIEVEEEIFGLGLSASVSYRTLGDMEAWLAKSGLFQPIELRWEPWEQSVHEIEEPRGISNLEPDPIAQDRLVNQQYATLPQIRDKHIPHIDPTITQPEHLCNPLPPANQSWAHFEAFLDLYQYGIERDHWVPLGPQAMEDGVINLNELKRAGRGDRTEIPSVLATNSAYPTSVVYRGMAIRVGYDIPMPKLVIPGATVRMIEHSFKPAFLGIFYCQPVYAAKWEILYQLSDLPASVSPGIKNDGSSSGGSLTPGTGGTGSQNPPNNP